MAMKSNPIKINPANKGKLRAKTGTKKGANIPASKLAVKSGDSAETKKQKIFAQNARKWNKG